MSNASHPITMNSIDPDVNMISGFDQRESPNNISHNNNNHQNFYNNFHQQPNLINQHQYFHHQNQRNQQYNQYQDFQAAPNSQSFYNAQKQFSQSLMIPQSNQDNDEQQIQEQKKYPEGINYYKTYNYDLYNINYQRISIESWNNIPVDESPYSYMWATPESFEPEQFSKIHLREGKSKKKFIDLFWLIFFYVNIFCSIGVFIYLIVKFKFIYDKKNTLNSNFSNSSYQQENNDNKLCIKEILIAVGIGAAIGLIFNIIHIVYSTFAPSIYIKDSIWLYIIISILCIILLVTKGFYYAFGFPIFTLFFALFFFCCTRKYMSFSADVLTMTIKLFWKYRIFILIISIDTFFELIFGLSFSLSIFFIEFTKTTRYLYIYNSFSFIWASSTLGYITYMTAAGLTSSWYFLNGTEFYPKNPVWDSFKRNCFKLFGSASLGGFLLSFVKLLDFVANSDNFCCNCQSAKFDNYNYTYTENEENNENERYNDHPEKAVLCLLKCIAICILKILEACIPFVNQYALIYCAIFEVPFKEGCRRSAEMSCHKFCHLLLSGCRIKSAMFFNGLILTVGSVSLALGISNYLFKKYNEETVFFQEISTPVYAFIFTFSIFKVFTRPFSTFADSLIICFSEAPERLKTSESNLYESMRSFYEKSVNEMIQNSYQ